MTAPKQRPLITFFTRKGCTLCDKIFPRVQSECNALGLPLEIVDVDTHPDLVRDHGDWVPVIAFNGRPRLRGIINPPWLTRELRALARDPKRRERVRVSVVILVDGEKMLINQRPAGTSYAGWWEWPGGKADIGEDIEVCAHRELAEEIGIEAAHLVKVGVWRVEFPERIIFLHVFAGPPKPESKPHAEAMVHRWVHPDEIRELDFLEPNLPILERFVEIWRAGELDLELKDVPCD